MWDTPAQNHADSLQANGWVFAIGPYSDEWVIYYELYAELAICAFKDRDAQAKFEAAFETQIMDGVVDAADYAYGTIRHREVQHKEMDTFIQNFNR